MFDRRVYHVLFALLILPLSGCASLQYSAEPIEARVVDAETKQPLEGVIITANWQLEEGTFGGNVQAGQLSVMETTTDKEGKFRFPGWGPLKVAKGHLVNRDPQLLLFKSGYESLGLENKYSSDRELRLRSVRKSDWNGKTIVLRPFKMVLEALREHYKKDALYQELYPEHDPIPGTLEEEYAKHLSFLHTSISSILDDGECNWKKIPRLIVAMDKQEKIFRSRNIYSPLYSIDDLPNGKCGSARDFFRGFMQ